MQLQDKIDELLGVLLANPDKISREMLRENSLSREQFSMDPASEHLFSLIVQVSYANKKVTPQLVDTYCSKNKLPQNLREDISMALFRASEQDSDFLQLSEKIFLFHEERKRWLLSKAIYKANDGITKGEDVEEVLNKIRESLSEITDGTEGARSHSIRGRGIEFLNKYDDESTEESLEYPFKPLDSKIGKILPGELHLIAGASGEGKSLILSNIIYHNLIYRRKNILLASLEMSETQCLYRLLSLHSTHPKFGYNLEHEKIKQKKLSPVEKEQFSEVIIDFFNNPEYGQLYITNDVITVQEIDDEATDIERYNKLDGIALDYISLLEGKGSTEQAIIAKNFKLVKKLAMKHKIPLVSVHQISEQAKEKAEEAGFYEFNFLADSAESRKSSDCVLWMLRTKQHKENHEILMGAAKVRDAEPPQPFSLFEHFEVGKAEAIDTEL